MKPKLSLTICTVGLALFAISANAQDINARTRERTADSLAVVKERSMSEKASDQNSISDLKDKRSSARAKAREARRSEKEASSSAKEAQSAYKSERKAQKARSRADKQARKAARAKSKVD